MTRSTMTTAPGTRGAQARPVIPAPRRSPENSPEPSGAREAAYDHPPYPLVRYALEHATALRPRRD